ncbi:MAG: FAD-dependent oxidoreductase, partial [Acidobacteriota bacterium]|nr:FAD-dependent oxidoreductase [Acidobacteriota bacterium]
MPHHGNPSPYNVVVIGAGTAGLVTAAGTAGLGGRVAVVERGRMGGDCLNTGCVPSKALIASARLADRMRHAKNWGLVPSTPVVDYEPIAARMRSKRERLAGNDSQERFEGLGVDVYRGEARFVSAREVRVGETTLRATNFVIATGSRPAIPEIPGLDSVRFYTNESIFDKLDVVPRRLAILGGGPIGCELGQAFARFGARVTILQRAPQILEKEDADVAGAVRRQFEAEGIEVLAGTDVERVRAEGSSIVLELAGSVRKTVTADALLIAAGRAPNVEDLDLAAAGVAFTDRGVTVNAHLQTSRPHIY